MCEVTFTTKTTMHTECTVKHQRTKVIYELWRIKKGFWGIGTSGNWMLCGKTYEIIQEETNQQVIETPPSFSKPGSSGSNSHSTPNLDF